MLVPHHYCGEPPRTHSLHSSSQLDAHKDTKASNTQKAYSQELKHQRARNTPESQSSFIAAIYRQWSRLQLCQLCQSASCSVLTLFWDFSLSHHCWLNSRVHNDSTRKFYVKDMFSYCLCVILSVRAITLNDLT